MVVFFSAQLAIFVRRSFIEQRELEWSRSMKKNVVLCADGTCNAFGASASSNVARLIELLDLASAHNQIAIYQQGLGTLEREHRQIEFYKRQLEQRVGQSEALQPLPPPTHSTRRPRDWPYLIAAMTAGRGLENNVADLYTALVEYYRNEDRVFLFGFSRGAFTVRALAGFLWRFGIPADGDSARAKAIFSRLWPIFKCEFPDDPRVGAVIANALRADLELIDCRVHFMGLWDTVKSYGGLWPIMLPHLRHNPSVDHVRHALALDERRGWFESTKWGWLDSDHPAQREQDHRYPADRIADHDRALIEQQDVEEVWFTGCHADVGGGNGNGATADVALRWMLGEANAFELTLNSEAEAFMAVPASQEKPVKRESRNWLWALVESIGRQSIDNSGEWPTCHRARGARPRVPDNWRHQIIRVHESVGDLSRLTPPEHHYIKTAYTSRTVRQWP